MRKDGTISYNGKVYNSLSHAARAVCKRGRNGWQFWRFKSAKDEWVPIRELARQ